jgi:DHA2 family multidrug resistance protein-like MFS transporter
MTTRQPLSEPSGLPGAPPHSPPPPPFDEGDGLPAPRRYWAVATVLAAILMAVLDGSIVNIALPSIARSLGAPAAETIWVVSAYQLVLVMALFPLAALAERLGLRRVFTGGVVVFTAASALCTFAPTLPWLVGARLLQGLGAAAVMCVNAGLLRHTYPARQLGRGIGINAVCVAMGTAIGPSLGAAIVSHAGWPWLFAINLPLGLLILVMSRALPRTRRTARRIDPASVLLNALALGLAVVGVDQLASRTLPALAMLAVSGASLWLLVRRESGNPAPLIPLDLLGNPTFRQTAMASVCTFCGQLMSFIALPFYMQHALGFTPLRAGLLMTPWPAAVAVAAVFAGRLADRHSPLLLCACGTAALTLGLALTAAWPPAHLAQAVWPLVLLLALAGAGFGFFQVPNNRAMLTSAPKARSGAAGGVQATARQFGQALGAAGMALLFSALGDRAPRYGIAGAALLFATAAGISLYNHRTTRDRPAA